MSHSSQWSWEVGADAGAVHALLCASDAHHATAYGLPAPSRNPAKTRLLVAAGAVQVLMRGTAMVAMFTLTSEPPSALDASGFPPALRPAYLQRLCVDPPWLERGPAVAVRCLRRAVELARAKGHDVLRAEANPDLLSTAALLGAFGFAQYGPVESAGQLRRVRLHMDLTAPGGRAKVAGLSPDVLVRQVESLAADLRALAGPVTAQVRDVLGSPGWSRPAGVYLTGAGDSYHAGRAAQMAFEAISRVPCSAVSAQVFADYRAPAIRLHPGRPVLIAASASGRTPEIVAALASASSNGARTIAVTGHADSPVARAADHSVVVALPGLERSPGIRTYQATLLGLLAIAVELAAAGRAEAAAEPGQQLGQLADQIQATALLVQGRCRDLASVIAESPVMAFLGSGPSIGSALFGAAKMVEAAGVAAFAQDLDEWWHVERRALPANMPVFVIAPPGRSYPRAVQVAEAASRLGRRVVAVVDQQDTAVARHAYAVLPVCGPVREELSPLLYHVFAGYAASFVAMRLGRRAFQDDPHDMPRTLDGFGRPDPASATTGLTRLVADIVRRHLPPEGAAALAGEEARLADLGLTSLALASLVVDLEREMAVVFPADVLVPETFWTLRSVADAVVALAADRGASGRRPPA